MYEVTGTIVSVEIRDVSKRADKPKKKTSIILKVASTRPPDLLTKLNRAAQEFTRSTLAGVDDKLKAGDEVRIEVSSIDYTLVLPVTKITPVAPTP